MYWAKGTKDKPHRRHEHVSLVNSDPDVIRLFCRWLDLLAVPYEDRNYRVCIHESAAVSEVEAYWADVVGVPVDRFRPATLKRHNPTTVRHNIGEGYRGCLVVRVNRSAQLYRRIEGWWRGLVAEIVAPDALQ